MTIFGRGLALLLLSPYALEVGADSTDDKELWLAIAAGGGNYAEVSRDCEGNVHSVKHNPYSDFAGAVRYRSSVLELGVAGGVTSGVHDDGAGFMVYDANGPRWVEEEHASLVYATPSIGIRTQYFGLEAGYLFPLNRSALGSTNKAPQAGMPSGSLRIGSLDGTYFSTGVARNLPLLAGGGLVDAGLSSPIGPNGTRLWYGIGAYPYDNPVFSLKGDLGISRRFFLTPTLHLKDGDAFEWGGSIGARLSF